MKFKKIIAGIVSGICLITSSIIPMTVNAEYAVGYFSTGKSSNFTGASLELTQKTITLDEAKNAQMITLSAKSLNATKFDSTGIHITYDEGLELVPIEIKGTKVNAEDMLVYGAYRAVTDGANGLFLTFGNDTSYEATTDGVALWQFQLKVKNPEVGKKYPINVSFVDGDLFDLKGSVDTEKIRDYAFSNVKQGYIEIAAPTTTPTTTTTKVTNTTTEYRTTTITTTYKITTATTDPLKLDVQSISLGNGEQYSIPINIEDVIFKSNNTDVAVVSPSGIVTAIGLGNAVISIIDNKYNVVQLFVNVTNTPINTSTNAASTTTSITTTTTSYPIPVKKINVTMWGDANVDGKVNVADVVAIKNMATDMDRFLADYGFTFDKAQGRVNADVVDPQDITGMPVNPATVKITGADADRIIRYIISNNYDMTISVTPKIPPTTTTTTQNPTITTTTKYSYDDTRSAVGNLSHFDEVDVDKASVKPILSLSRIELSLEEARANPSQMITLSIQNAEKEYCAGGISIIWDKKLSFVGADDKVVYGSALKSIKILDKRLDSYNNQLFIAFADNKNDGKDGVMCYFPLTIPSDCKPGDIYPIQIRYGNVEQLVNEARDETMEAWTFTKGIVQGYIKITSEKTTAEFKAGDANCDTQVDMSDVVLIMQSLANPNKYGLEGTDKNHITEQGQLNGDVDTSIKGITSGDALRIQEFLLKKIITLDYKRF